MFWRALLPFRLPLALGALLALASCGDGEEQSLSIAVIDPP